MCGIPVTVYVKELPMPFIDFNHSVHYKKTLSIQSIGTFNILT